MQSLARRQLNISNVITKINAYANLKCFKLTTLPTPNKPFHNISFKNKSKSIFKSNPNNKTLFNLPSSYFSTNTPNNKLFENDLLLQVSEQTNQYLKQATDMNRVEFIQVRDRIKKQIETKKQLELKDLVSAIGKFDFIDLVNKESGEEFILNILRSNNFYKIYLAFPNVNFPSKNFTNLFYECRLMDTLTADDLSNFQDWYFDMDKPSREFKISDRIMMLDAMYVYKLKYGEEIFNKSLSKMHNHIIVNFAEFMTSFASEEIIQLLNNLIFYPNDEISLLSDSIVNRMNYIINPKHSDKVKITFSKNLSILQAYPRILNLYKEKSLELFEKESAKIKEYLISNAGNVNENHIDITMCMISNYLIWVENSPEVLEAYIPYFYKYLASFRHEITLELFFLLLNSDFRKYDNYNGAINLINMIYQFMKNMKISRMETIGNSKEVKYFYSIRESLIDNYTKWDEKHSNQSYDHPDYYHNKILREFIRKSCNIYPFAAVEYTDELFDNLLSNIKEYISFSK